MDREAEHEKIRQMLTATIVSLCNNSLMFDGELTIQGLLGITLDRKDIILVNIQENICRKGSKVTHGKSQSHSSTTGAVLSGTQVIKMEHEQQLQQQQPPMTQHCTALQPYVDAVQNSMAITTPGGGVSSEGKVLPQPLDWCRSARNKKSASTTTVPRYTATNMQQPTSLQHIKLEPCSSEFTAGGAYYSIDGDQYEGYYDQGSGSSAGSGLYAESSAYSDEQYLVAGDGMDPTNLPEPFNRPPPAKKRSKITQSKRCSVAATASRPLCTQPASTPGTPGSTTGSKEVNSSLVQRALDLVHEGQLTAGVAIKLFGIPRSTFYKKLSMCNPPKQSASDPVQYYTGEEDYQYQEGAGEDHQQGAGIDEESLMSAGTNWTTTDSAAYTDYYTS